MSFPRELREFIDQETWTYAKKMPEWPHEYIVRERVDEELFVQLVKHTSAPTGTKAVSTAARSPTSTRTA